VKERDGNPPISMNRFEPLLSQGDLTSDGLANEVVRIVGDRPQFLPDLVEMLAGETRAVRGHAADALEKVARKHPVEVAAWTPQIVEAAQSDDVPVVRWHMAMVLGHLSVVPAAVPTAVQTLCKQLADPSPFVRSWAITSLCRLGRDHPDQRGRILPRLVQLMRDPRPSVAKRAQTAVRLLSHPETRLPASWVKTA